MGAALAANCFTRHCLVGGLWERLVGAASAANTLIHDNSIGSASAANWFALALSRGRLVGAACGSGFSREYLNTRHFCRSGFSRELVCPGTVSWERL